MIKIIQPRAGVNLFKLCRGAVCFRGNCRDIEPFRKETHFLVEFGTEYSELRRGGVSRRRFVFQNKTKL